MSEQFNADLNIIQSTPITLELLDGNLNVIQQLDDEPNDVGGLTSAELKAKFDQAGNMIKEYINETLIPAVLASDATEVARINAETAREQAENVRIAAETARDGAEAQRAEAEESRATAETVRVDAESDRVSAEQARAAAEEARSAAEMVRTTAETARGTAETARAEAETARTAAEAARSVAETARETAETARAEAEAARASAETARTAAETARAAAEEARGNEEAARQFHEQGRISNEEARLQAEADRCVWEEYNAAGDYVPGNKVFFEGSSYLCVAPCSGIAPDGPETDGGTLYWKCIAKRGDTGAEGPQGPAGVKANAFSAVLRPDAWTGNEQVINADNAPDGAVVLAGAAPSSRFDYDAAGIDCVELSNGELTFACETVPTAAIEVNILIMEVRRT